MTFIRVAFFALYGALSFTAIPAQADIAAAMAARDGTLMKLQFENSPVDIDLPGFENFVGEPLAFSMFEGKMLLVNFWATWCAPCRREMPGLDRLKADLGGPHFEVITIATGRNDPMKMQTFFADTGLLHLPLYRDPGFELPRALGINGLPFTILLDADGRKIAHLIGDAEWDSPSAYAVIEALLEDVTK